MAVSAPSSPSASAQNSRRQVLGNEDVQWDILAEGGVHFVTGLGSRFLTETDAALVALPYAGARVGAVARRGSGPNPGFWIFARFDVDRTTTVVHTDSSGDEDITTYDVGGYTVGVTARFVIGG